MNPGELARTIEHSLLRATATAEDVRTLCAEAIEYGFYSVCINPCRVRLASRSLRGTGVRVTTVVGFPLGAVASEIKAREAMGAVYDGAHEIDMVMNIGAAREGDWDGVERDISIVRHAIKGAADGPLLKVIIECCYLDEAQKVRATEAAVNAGADFVKTSTGFGPSGATVEDVALIMGTLSGLNMKDALRQSGTHGPVRIKAAGGIKTLADITSMLRAGADLIGTSSGVAMLKEAASG